MSLRSDNSGYFFVLSYWNLCISVKTIGLLVLRKSRNCAESFGWHSSFGPMTSVRTKVLCIWVSKSSRSVITRKVKLPCSLRLTFLTNITIE